MELRRGSRCHHEATALVLNGVDADRRAGFVFASVVGRSCRDGVLTVEGPGRRRRRRYNRVAELLVYSLIAFRSGCNSTVAKLVARSLIA
jgi:hypothetical protein